MGDFLKDNRVELMNVVQGSQIPRIINGKQFPTYRSMRCILLYWCMVITVHLPICG